MPFVETENGCRVFMAQHIGSQVIGSSLWFSKADFDDADMQALVNEVMDTFSDEIADSLANDVVAGPFVAYDMREEDGTVVFSNIGTNAGENVNQILPLANCIVLTLRTAKRGRAYRGRSYFSGFTEAEIGETGWDSASIGIVEAFGEALITRVAGLGWAWGVHSAQLNGVPRDPQIVTPIVSVEVRNNQPGYQRLRVQRP